MTTDDLEQWTKNGEAASLDILQHATEYKMTAFEAFDIASQFFPDEDCTFAGKNGDKFIYTFQPKNLKPGTFVPDQTVIIGEDGKVYSLAFPDLAKLASNARRMDPAEYRGQMQHYGRKGMKWYEHIYGKEDSRGKYNDHDSGSGDKKKSGGEESKEVKSAATLLVSYVAVTALMAVKNYRDVKSGEKETGYKLTGELEKHTKDGKDLLKNTPKADKKYKNEDGTYKLPYKLVNPDFGFAASEVYKNNCAACTATCELQRRGFLVEARPRAGITSYDIGTKLFKNSKQEHYSVPQSLNPIKNVQNTRRMWDDTKNYIKSLPDGARGDFSFSGDYGGHSVYFEKVPTSKRNKNGFRIVDGQIGEVYDTDFSIQKNIFTHASNDIFITRYDNLQPNEDYISNVSRPMREKSMKQYNESKGKGRTKLSHSEADFMFESLFDEELEHYGRKGMKWYTHIFGDEDSRAQYQFKADNKKLRKNSEKAEKQRLKAERYSAKASRNQAKVVKLENKLTRNWPIIRTVDEFRKSRNSKKYYKNAKKAYKATRKSTKAARRAEKIAKLINRYLEAKDLQNLSADEKRLYRKYAIEILDEMEKES